MCLSVTTSPPATNLPCRASRLRSACRSTCLDDGAAIEPSADADVQGPRLRGATHGMQQPIGLLWRRCEGESSRSPRTLTDAESTFAREEIEDGGHVGAGKSVSALQWSEMVAEPCLDFLDCGAEARHVDFRDGRQQFHQRETAEMSRIAGREGRQ